jgi:hypothetical protein
MSHRTRRSIQEIVALVLLVVGVVVVVIPFLPIQYPDWWPNVGALIPSVPVPWWPVVTGIGAASHYSARVFLTIAFGLIIFLPQVETTFVSLMRRQSGIGAPFVDRKNFTCGVCGAVNRPSVQFCVKCGSQISTGTRHWAQQRERSGSSSVLKAMLCISAFLAFFLGIFDLTLYTTITTYVGTDGGTVIAATVLASVPSLSGYLALKEGPFRKYGTLKQFDKLVFGDIAWILFGVLFLALAAINLLGQGLNLLGTWIVLIVQLLLGAFFFTYPLLRRRVSQPVTMAYP